MPDFARPILAILLLAALAAGCSTNSRDRARSDLAVAAFYRGDFARAREILEPISDDANEDYVLMNLRLGSAALADHDPIAAEAAFFRAYETITAGGVNDPARVTAAVIGREEVRVFKGEPYERAMAMYYLGVCHYLLGDLDNARGAFEAALFRLRVIKEQQDEDADEAEVQLVESSFGTGLVLLGRCQARLGLIDAARQTFEQLRTYRPDLAPLADVELHRDTNLLLIVEAGIGPRAYGSQGGVVKQLGPLPAEAGTPPAPRVFVDDQRVRPPGTESPTVDLLALAQEQRWQTLETWRQIKNFTGNAALVGGGILIATADNDEWEQVAAGLALAGLGLLSKASSQADLRYLETLPRAVYVIPVSVPPGVHDVSVELPAGFREVGPNTQTFHGVVVPEHGDRALYFRPRSRWPQAFDWPPPPGGFSASARPVLAAEPTDTSNDTARSD